jgi:hypothetical protein
LTENVAGRAAREGNESWPGATRHDAVSLCLVFFWTLGVCCDPWPVPPGFCGALVGPIAVFVATAACCGACSTIRVRAKSCGGALAIARLESMTAAADERIEIKCFIALLRSQTR